MALPFFIGEISEESCLTLLSFYVDYVTTSGLISKSYSVENPSGNPARRECMYVCLGSLLAPLTAAIMKTEEGEGMLEILEEWQCPDPLAKVIFRIEVEKS